ncbi:MAG: cytochrome c-type biogenesis protein CcmH [Acidimicrobiia bacterium]|nr:cytochrome c-type biogenesis protein CcmH [Acidimicrobiia bacterium]MDH3396681.1 cytochrome c-type biogenesis protein CcmH [Acidimicrobiia bacterium]
MDSGARTLGGRAITIVLAVVVVVGLVIGDSAPQDRVNAIGSRIKCPVCQGEAIGDSPSETARAMMEIVAEKVTAGETDAQIVDYFTARYGNGILLDPPFSGSTLVVWLLPALAVAGGVWMILSRKRQPAPRGSEHG